MKTTAFFTILVLLAALLSACVQPNEPGASGHPASSESTAQNETILSSVNSPESEPEALPCYFDQVADAAIASLGLTGQEDDFERVRLAFNYVVARTSFIEYDQPELVDNWRYHDACGEAPTIYEIMGMGPLLYGIGTCEHYAAALMVLLERMGYDTRYVPGLTYSVEGQLIDHAWAMVKIGDNWYHIDPQLEDNVARGNQISYKYFLKGDEYFAAHHVWGNRLLSPDPHSQELPHCAESAPLTAAVDVLQAPPPDVDGLVQQARKEQSAAQGHLSALEPNGELPPLPGEYEALLAEEKRIS